jgi:hypothetical protein
MNTTERVKELAGQVQTAAAAGNLAEVNRICAEIERQQGPRSFTDAWNYENRVPDPQPGSFAEAWGFQPGKDSTR